MSQAVVGGPVGTGGGYSTQSNPGPFITAVIVIAIALTGAYALFVNWDKLFGAKPLQAIFIFPAPVFEALPRDVARGLDRGRISINVTNNIQINGDVRLDGGGDKPPPQASCTPSYVQAIIAVGGFALTCQIVDGYFRTQARSAQKDRKTIIVDALKDKIIVHEQSGGDGGTIIVRKNNTEVHSVDYAADGFDCAKSFEFITQILKK
ncbi:MAG: hypothetical protein C3F11_01410 [Methylocystaceae bacterium]|nr:MAG: hypothetical protein C3F11_01410 [Methylocystaceae bacterium]